MTRGFRFITCGLLICLACLSRLRAQVPQPKLQPRPAADQRLVLDVVMQHGVGALEQTPTPSSLRVNIDGKTIPSTNLTVTKTPPVLVFVLDAINTPRGDLVRSREALLEWLHAAGDRLPFDTSILVVADARPVFKGLSPGTVASWELVKNELYVARISSTRLPSELAAKLNAYEPGLSRLGDSAQALNGTERFHLSLQALSFLSAATKAVAAPKLLLWISPGWPPLHLTQHGLSGEVFDTIVYFNDALFSSRVLLYALDPEGAATAHPAPAGDELLALRPGMNQQSGPMRTPVVTTGSDFYKNFLEPVRSKRDADPNNMLLQVLAVHSGGTVQASSNDLLDGITRFVADAHSVFTVTAAADQRSSKESFHIVHVKESGTGDTVRSTTGFYER